MYPGFIAFGFIFLNSICLAGLESLGLVPTYLFLSSLRLDVWLFGFGHYVFFRVRQDKSEVTLLKKNNSSTSFNYCMWLDVYVLAHMYIRSF